MVEMSLKFFGSFYTKPNKYTIGKLHLRVSSFTRLYIVLRVFNGKKSRHMVDFERNLPVSVSSRNTPYVISLSSHSKQRKWQDYPILCLEDGSHLAFSFIIVSTPHPRDTKLAININQI